MNVLLVCSGNVSRSFLAEAKVELLSRYLSGDWAEDDVMDPYGKSPYHYRAVQSQIRLAVQNLALWIGENA